MESFTLLKEFGVTVKMAFELSTRFSPDIVRAGIKYVKQSAHEGTRSLPGLLVYCLTEGTAAEYAGTLEIEHAEQLQRLAEAEAAERRSRHIEAVNVAMAHATWNAPASQQDTVKRAIANIRAAWPKIEQIFDAGVLSDDMLGPEMNPVAVFKCLAGKAKDVLVERGEYTPPPEGIAPLPAQTKTDGLALAEMPASVSGPPGEPGGRGGS